MEKTLWDRENEVEERHNYKYKKNEFVDTLILVSSHILIDSTLSLLRSLEHLLLPYFSFSLHVDS